MQSNYRGKTAPEVRMLSCKLLAPLGLSEWVAGRGLGILLFAAALGCPDIGEAQLANGTHSLITLGRSITKQQQFWFANNTTNHQSGSAMSTACELVLGAVFAGTDMEDWVCAGIRLTMDNEGNWNPCEATSAADGPSEKS